MKSALNENRNGLKKQMFSQMLSGVVASSMAAAFIGCAGGTNTNPVAKYDDLIKNSVTEEQAGVTPSQKNSGYTPRIFITPDDKGQRPELNFEEGKESSYSLSAILNDNVYVSGATYKIAPVGLPEGATLTQDPKNKEQYILKWKPSYSTVAPGQDKKSVKFSLEIKDIKAPNDEMMGYIKNTKLSESFSLNIAVDNKVPAVTNVTGLMDEYAEGKTYDISLTVTDLGGHPALLPSLVKVNRTFDCKENQCFVDAAQYLNLAKVEDLKNGQWKMTLQLNLQQKAIDFASASNKLNAKGQEGAGFELSFKVQGGRGKFSSTVSKKGFIVYKAEAKKPIFSVPTGYVVPVGTNAKSTPTTFSLYSSVDSNRGKLAIDSEGLASAIKALPGSNKVTCKYVGDSKTSEVCNVVLSFPCGTKQTFPVVAKAAHNVNGGVQTSEVALRIQVSESADCKAIADQKKAAEMQAAADKAKAAARAKAEADAKAKADAAAKAKAAADAKAKADAAAKAAAGKTGGVKK